MAAVSGYPQNQDAQFHLNPYWFNRKRNYVRH